MAGKLPSLPAGYGTSNGLEDRGTEQESDEELPAGLPQFDQLPEDQQATLEASVGFVCATLQDEGESRAAGLLDECLPAVTPVVPDVVAAAAQRTVSAPPNIIRRSTSRISSSGVGQALSDITNEFVRNQPIEARRMRQMADEFLRRNRGQVTYSRLAPSLDGIFHESFDLDALARLHFFVAHLMLGILREVGPNDNAQRVCTKIMSCFLAYLLSSNLLSFATKLLLEFASGQRMRGPPTAGTSSLVPFASGLSVGFAVSGVIAFVLWRCVRRVD